MGDDRAQNDLEDALLADQDERLPADQGGHRSGDRDGWPLAHQSGQQETNALLRVLIRSVVYVPSTTAWPQVSPLFVTRGGLEYITVYSSQERAALSAPAAAYVLQMTAGDVLTFMPKGFGLVVNPGQTLGVQVEAVGIPKIVADLVRPNPLLQTIVLESYAKALRFSVDGETVICAQFHDVSLWHVTDEHIERRSSFSVGFKRFYSIALSPDGTRLAAVGEPTAGEGHLSLWSLPEGQKQREWVFPDTYLLSAVFSPDGTRLLTAGDEEVLHVIDLRTGEIMLTPEYDDEDEDYWGLGERNTSLVYHPDGKTVLVTACYQAGTLIVFCEVASALMPRPDLTIQLPADEMSGAAFSPDGHFFACADWDLHLYRFPAQEQVSYFDISGARHTGSPPDRGGQNVEKFWSNALFTPDGQTLLCGGPSGTIFLWDMPGGDLRRTLTGHEGGIISLALSPDGTRLVSSGQDKTLRLWRISS